MAASPGQTEYTQEFIALLEEFNKVHDVSILLYNAYEFDAKEQAVCYALAGAEYNKNMIYDEAIPCLIQSLKIYPALLALYNLGYAYEMLQNTEQMLKYYELAIDEYNCPSCRTRIGKYYLYTNVNCVLGISPEQHLIYAMKRGYIQASNILIEFYKNQYDARIKCMIEKYYTTHDFTQLKDEMIKFKDWFRYIAFTKQYSVTHDPHCIDYINNIVCCNCQHSDTQCVMSSCGHGLCIVCTNRITLSNHTCPKCGVDLFKM